MKKLLFTMPRSSLKEILERCTSKAPEPLNCQSPDRHSKEEALEGYSGRKQMKKTSLFPSG